ncbi:MAG: hypothetical protein KDN20_15400 [Verrucomicrobiae bacterium]|nr:hypothetical protein [Verrucomicrobiae bacterium]
MENYTCFKDLPPGMTRVGRLQSIFGEQVTLIQVAWGEKRPIQKEFQKLDVEVMRDPEHLRMLEGSNIGILVGPASGNLISIDFDEEEAEKEFCEANPDIVETVRSKGSRGANYWYLISGDYVDKIVKLKRDGAEVGEWRGGGGHTVVDGLHPSEVPYYISSAHPVKVIEFSDIHWPENWEIGSLEEGDSEYDALVQEYGPPVEQGKNGGIALNEGFVVGWILRENDLLYDLDLGAFFTFSNAEGIWSKLDSKEMEKMIAIYLNRLARECEEAVRFKRNQRLIASIRQQLEAAAATRLRELRSQIQWHFYAALNGIVPVIPPDLPQAPIAFHRGYYLTEKSAIAFAPSQPCPRFLGELLTPVLDPDDIHLLQRVCGLVLIGPNDLQKIVLLEGSGLTGKSIYQLILDTLVGLDSVTQLRAENLTSRFELSRYVGKRLVAGRDVPPDFLRQKGAALLKALTGGDRLNTERKNSNDDVPLKGDLHAIITSNAALRVKVESDGSAWERRLVILPFERTSDPPKRILNFDQILLKEEGGGILNWHLWGAIQALQEIEAYGDLLMTDEQKDRIAKRVRESDLVGLFVEECIEKGGIGLSTEQLGASYREFCTSRGLPAESEMSFSKKLRSELEHRFQAQPTENFVTDAKSRKRGYYNVRFKENAGQG